MDQYAVVDPATGELVSTYPTATDAEVRAAVDTVAGAHAAWAAKSIAERAAIVQRIGDLHIERAAELGEIIHREMGKPVADAVGETEFSGAIFQYYGRNAEALLADKPIALEDGEGSAFMRPSSVGALLGIMPWNFPAYQVARFAGALSNLGVAKGDRVVIYMPMVPEAAIAMLACARIGAVHSVVFGGFAPHELAVRIDDAEPVVVVSASCGIEGKKVLPYKPMLDAAIDAAKSKPRKCVILQRPQIEATLIKGRDVTWEDAISGS